MTEHTDKVDRVREKIKKEERANTPTSLHANNGKLEVRYPDGFVEIYKQNMFGKLRLIEEKQC